MVRPTSYERRSAAERVRHRIFAWLLARCGHKTDTYLAEHKLRLFAGVYGTILAIGPGAGVNLRHLSKAGIKWIGIEPNPYAHKHLLKEACRTGLEVELRHGTAEDLPANDVSVDFVISTLVLCSVENQDRSLQEVLRVLKPGGKLLFIEHVAAALGSRQRRIQTLVEPLWRQIADGCHPARDTTTALKCAGFETIAIREFAGPIPIIRPH